MSVATLTTKGQITIPASIRDYLHLKTGDNIEFLLEETEGRVILLPLTRDITGLKALLRKPAKHLSIEEIDHIIKKRGAQDERD